MFPLLRNQNKNQEKMIVNQYNEYIHIHIKCKTAKNNTKQTNKQQTKKKTRYCRRKKNIRVIIFSKWI